MFRIAHRQVRGDGACHLVDALSHTELLAENAALRRQLILFRRQVKRPELHPFDRFMLLVHAAFTRTHGTRR
jgi:hypothetical protein